MLRDRRPLPSRGLNPRRYIPLQADLAKACPAIVSTRFIGDVFNDELGQPGSFFNVKWSTL